MTDSDNGMTIYAISKRISSTILFLTGQTLELQYFVKFLKKIIDMERVPQDIL
ncbi:hypothetical protein [Streptococcus sanguinis]|uniref:hypothetical protein n=1 Tax=Streptococcus sanguinis TaxID=1305 RepID=UPI00165A03A0|nr:hypothetical protein [Streptococcus sanguinis]